MFDQLYNTYTNIIMEFGIVGYSEQDIIKRGVDSETNLPLNLLYLYPRKEKEDVEMIFQMMFPDDDHKIPTPKFFSLTLTNEKGNRTFLYCLKFPEKFNLPIEDSKSKKAYSGKKLNNYTEEKNDISQYVEVPLVIYIKSHKEDLESFKQLLYSINQIIVDESLEKINDDPIMINNYKKIQLTNLLFFLFSLPHTSPHTLIKLQLNQELDNILKMDLNEQENETIDFYFSSNCEIPCNKNDTDINILFLVLDQSIIIKVLFSILTEKQIIFTASQAYLLHLIISTFLKLIFPFKWHHSCITVLPKDNLELLEIPGPYIFGVLSSHLSTKDLIDEYDGKIIVDCDTNEIFGYNNLEPYEPPDIINRPSEDKKKKDKKKDNKELEINNLESNNFAQGKNLIIINKNTIYKYNRDITNPLKKLVFDYDNNIIIDVQKSQLFIDKNDIFIDSNDWKWLRRNIQLVRNPELFNLDSIDFQKQKKSKRISYDEDNPILPNRPFSYNIQNIILNFILRKLSFKESDFMSVFTKTNLYLEYEDQNKEFDNMKGKIIVQNILETKNQPRSIENSFIIEYILNQFNTEDIIDKLNSKINDLENTKGGKNKNNDKKIDIYQNLQKILKDYSKIKEDINAFNKNNMVYKNTNIYTRKITQRTKSVSENTNPILNMGKSSKNLLKHVKNNKSLLEETSGQNKYLLLGFDKDMEDTFQFYSKDGFIFFANKLDEFLQEEDLDIKKIIYKNNLNQQILNLINKGLKLENKEENEIILNVTKSKKNSEKIESIKNLDKKKLRQIIGVSIVPENKEEEINENNNDNDNNIINKSQGSVEIKKDEDYDFADNFMKNGEIKNQIFDWNPNDTFDEINNTINFSNFNVEKELENNEGMIKDENGINHLMQFYLFLAFYLEKEKNDKISLKFFCDNFFPKDDNNEINNKVNENNNNIIEPNENIYEIIEKEGDKSVEENKGIKDINEIIIKLYIQAYNYSDKKHRDFPYFSFYNFLKQISSQDLKNYNDLFNIDDNLISFYSTIIFEKQKEEVKELIKYKKKTYILEANNNNDNKNIRNSNIDYYKNKLGTENYDIFDKRQALQKNMNNNNNNIKISNFIAKSPTIQDFIEENGISTSIINDIGEIINKELSKFKSDFSKKNINDILEEMNSRIKSNENLKILIDNLKYIDFKKIDTKKKCFSFWINCFNYLIIYRIFSEKLNLSDEKKWKEFFNAQCFNIGGINFSSNDIQYIIFNKSYFFSSTYKPQEFAKKLSLENKIGELKLDEKEKLIPFILYLPINSFLKPSLYSEENIENDINKRIKDYLNKYVTIDKKNYLCCYDFLLKFNPNIFAKELQKYENYFKPDLNDIIKNKKYKKLIQLKIAWQLNFDNIILDEGSIC